MHLHRLVIGAGNYHLIKQYSAREHWELTYAPYSLQSSSPAGSDLMFSNEILNAIKYYADCNLWLIKILLTMC